MRIFTFELVVALLRASLVASAPLGGQQLANARVAVATSAARAGSSTALMVTESAPPAHLLPPERHFTTPRTGSPRALDAALRIT